MWDIVTEINSSDGGEISASARIPEGSEWFSGHFPDDPILPGIAQIGLVCQIMEQALGGHVFIQSFSRIRFKKIIRPGDQLNIKTSRNEARPGSYSFSLMIDADTVCTGSMAVKIPV